jgi:hypothetical protein
MKSKVNPRAAPGRGALFALGMLGMSLSLARAEEVDPGQGKADLGQSTMQSALTVNLSTAPKMRPEDSANQMPPPRPRSGVSEEEYNRRKAMAAAQAQTRPAIPAPPPLQSGEVQENQIGRETPGASVAFPGQSEQGSIVPSDMAVAVSGSFVVQVVNSSIAVYNKSGTLQAGFPKTLQQLFPGSTGDVGDPRAFYDWSRGRFVVIADDFSGGNIWLAASSTGDPRGSWHIYSLNVWGPANCRIAGAACADFPMAGYDDSTIYVSLNLFPAGGGVSDFMLLLPKENIYAGTSFSFNFWFNLSFGGINVDTVQPVTLLTPSEHPRAGFAVNSFNINFGGGQCSSSPCNGLGVWAFSNNLPAEGSPGPELSGVIVATANDYRFPALADEPGCAFCIDTNDPRISGTPIYHSGTITGALNTNGSDGHSHVLWFQVVPTLNDNNPRCTGTFLNKCPQITTAQLINEDCYFCGGQGAAGSTYFGTLAPDVEGDLTMVFGYSDSNIFPESAYASRRVTQARNTLHDSGIVLCSGSAIYTQGRWGDYTAAVGDITSASQGYMWFSAMNVLSNGDWGTCIGKNGFTSDTQP